MRRSWGRGCWKEYGLRRHLNRDVTRPIPPPILTEWSKAVKDVTVVGRSIDHTALGEWIKRDLIDILGDKSFEIVGELSSIHTERGQ
jgi:hypothetical protein